MKFYSDSKVQQKLTATRPLMRLSLMCLQSCMPDHRDNIANFVTDTDLNKIKAKAAAKVVDEIETLLEEAIEPLRLCWSQTCGMCITSRSP